MRQDEELRAEIFLDVERCMPDNLYFREPSTQTMLLDILFVYCKLNRDIGYRQGMHEVLAPVLWVISRDAINSESFSEDHFDLDKSMISNLDENYVEHDTFTLFGAIMQTVKTFYETGSHNEPTTSGLLNHSPIVERSKRIHENYLHHADPELAEHLTAIEILPQIFLIRWVRLLFGREFPFEETLALWDVLFAEDPELDLVDLISVAMLLRIRWQRECFSCFEGHFSLIFAVLEADYSAALTLLLRYPVPLPPHGPQTFVSDAIYLRDNLLLDGGDHIISKYSRRAPETTVTRKLPRKIKRARTAEQEAAKKAFSPRMTPARLFQDQGGIEGIIHEAAKGVYSRGEKWGVGKALRGAVQGLQSGHNSPGGVLERPRRLLESRKMISDQPAEMLARIHALEQRNQSLAKLLENAVDELWGQQKATHEMDSEAVADALSLSIAKVQFVQVYLENTTMPLPTENTLADDTGTLSANPQSKEGSTASPTERHHVRSTHTDGSTDEALPANSDFSDLPTAAVPQTPRARVQPASSTQKRSSPPPRPSLEQSPFSWMLGGDQRKSGFVSTSPFQPEKMPRKSGSLFGDPRKDQKHHGNGSEDDDVFRVRDGKQQTGL